MCGTPSGDGALGTATGVGTPADPLTASEHTSPLGGGALGLATGVGAPADSLAASEHASPLVVDEPEIL